MGSVRSAGEMVRRSTYQKGEHRKEGRGFEVQVEVLLGALAVEDAMSAFGGYFPGWLVL